MPIAEERKFVPTAGEGKQHMQLRMSNKIQCIIPYVTLQQFNIVKHSSYINATTCCLIVRLTCLLSYYYGSAFTNTKLDPTHLIQYNLTRCECSLTSCPDTFRTVYNCACSKMPQHSITNNV